MRINGFMVLWFYGFMVSLCSEYCFGQDIKVFNNDTVYSQEDDSLLKDFETKNTSEVKRLMDATQKKIQKGNNFIHYGQKNYEKALEQYLLAYNDNENYADLNLQIGECYLHTGKKAMSVHYLEKALVLDKRLDNRSHFLLGMAYHLNADFDPAIKKYNECIENYKKDNRLMSEEQIDSAMREVYKKIKECEYAKHSYKNPVRVFIDNLGDSVNSAFPEYDPFITADESMLFFTSRRENSSGGKKSDVDYRYFEDIYVSSNNNGNGSASLTTGWSAPKNLGKKVNSKTNDAIIGISIDGQKMFVYRDKNGGDIYVSELNGEQWSKPVRKYKKLNTKVHESSASYSYDRRTIYYVSDKYDTAGLGGKDIYMSRMNKNGNWDAPVNLGPTINTPYDEACVFAHPNGKTIYFSSQGHNTMGGFDIFKSSFNNGEWSEPENLGYPINTVGDDVSFVVSANGKKGYYSSSNVGGMGDKDIYVITFLGPEKEGVLNTEDNLLAGITAPVKEKVIEPEVKIKENQLTLLKGIISDAITQEPLEASIEIHDNERNKNIGIFNSNSKTGKYLVSLPSGGNYGIAVRSKNYLFHSENFVIPASAEYQVIYKNIELKKLDVGSKIVLRNIFFDTDKDSLRSESYAELDRLAKLLNEFQNLRIEISGHTDNVGSARYNELLSQRRAKAVVGYLILEGIDYMRLEYAGYGFDQPIASNDTEEGRQQNRRTEFKILGTDYKSKKSDQVDETMK